MWHSLDGGYEVLPKGWPLRRILDEGVHLLPAASWASGDVDWGLGVGVGLVRLGTWHHSPVHHWQQRLPVRGLDLAGHLAQRRLVAQVRYWSCHRDSPTWLHRRLVMRQDFEVNHHLVVWGAMFEGQYETAMQYARKAAAANPAGATNSRVQSTLTGINANRRLLELLTNPEWRTSPTRFLRVFSQPRCCLILYPSQRREVGG